ncbi:twin-arginine translocation signal domain-containing protein [Streptomyces melanogenes]|uniref:twin-arginine translocation signal domain-containing protein n=1 Tax=Streptomyces melanogenes TaxID=67326 RepID=UPI00167D15C6|nr:twin-arginine translocation signal domain-containing protein [Streptomyces melanogenes]GGP92406.1 hypothetical protein GCM10010278_83130 [Streptomyces melanogenes]
MTESEIIDSGSDRRGFMKGAAVTAAAVGAGALATGTANAAGVEALGKGQPLPFPFPIPPIGVDIPCSCYAANVPLNINVLGVVNCDFKGGIDICVRAFTNNVVELEIVGHKVVCEIPGLRITIEQSDTQITPLSLLQINPGSGLFPVPFPEMIVKLLFTLTIQQLDSSGNPTGTPTVLSTDPTNPAVLSSGALTSFPPTNQGYTLTKAIPLLDQNGNQAGMLNGFPVNVNQA